MYPMYTVISLQGICAHQSILSLFLSLSLHLSLSLSLSHSLTNAYSLLLSLSEKTTHSHFFLICMHRCKYLYCLRFTF
jgi:hypothetical protein